MKPPVVFGLVSLGVLAFACAPRPRTGESTSQAQNQSRTATPKIESALAVSVNGPGEAVRFDFVVTNVGGGKVEMNFPSGQTHDVFVLDSLGREVWRWSDGQLFTQLLQNKILRASDTLVYGERWKDVPRGQYVAVARLASENFPVEQRATFVVR
ncbi:MAG: BsuPI-related putative proteinase inhibitor [Gemmatimonadetes bacterium]|nr:BsuPI-related putative proteinase inhibitor [Gemmatimonadota bacterium]